MELEKNIFCDIVARAKSLAQLDVSGLSGTSLPFLILTLWHQNPRPLLVVCENAKKVQDFASDIESLQNMFFANTQQALILLYPGWEFSPYRKLIPSTSARVNRLHTLFQIQHYPNSNPIVISSPEAIMQRTMLLSDFKKNTILLQRGSSLDDLQLFQKLPTLGYQKADPVEDPGSFDMRGGIIDIFSPAHSLPFRAELFDVQIEEIKFYNPISQRSFPHPESQDFFLLPFREMLLGQEQIQRARSAIKNWADSLNIHKRVRDRITEPLQNQIITQDMDYLHPFFSENTSGIESYLPKNTAVVWLDRDKIQKEAGVFLEKQKELYQKCIEQEEVACPPEKLFSAVDTVFSKNDSFSHWNLSSLQIINHAKDSIPISHTPVQQFATVSKDNKSTTRGVDLDALGKYLSKLFDTGYHVYFVANSQSQLDRFSFLLGQRKISCDGATNSSIHLLLGSINNGFLLPDERVAVLTEDEVFGQKIHNRKTSSTNKNQNNALSINPLEDIKMDDLVVHIDHGIGKYRGLVQLSPNGTLGDYVFLEYAGSDKLYLPIYRLETIQKYLSAGSGTATLDKLGSQQFAKTKEKVKAAVKDIAHKLLKIYAERASQHGHRFAAPDDAFQQFAATFPYDETPDQLKAIQQTIDDMCSDRPMDRLICGDVGFGKTEVAVRAAFKCAQEGKQSAILVPTTILAEQHFQTFSKRFKDQAIRVASISRFRSRREQTEILEELKQGKIDIIIGTHRLLSKDVHFHDLGLLVIDEEQRFGVEHKEKLKLLRATTDVLTLTATPIPRTLHLALMGIRDISIIQTAPENRLPIRTHLATFDPEVIKTAIEMEIARGGQVFFIHNRVQSIDSIYELLKKIVPKAKIAIGHGQMPESQLEKVMLDFYDKKFDILLATTIIENGLDVSNANTIIVNRADTFGLAQLYQIRGRVGRSQTRAHAYLLIPDGAAITEDARERLSILQRFTELGSGYAIASHDLELRGGGDILGDSQSGHITMVGYEMYLELLEEEILRLKGEEKKKVEDVEINSPFAAFLSKDYVPDTRSRLHLYKRLSALSTEEEIKDAENEIKDRFGSLPAEAQELFWLLRIKILARRLGFKNISIGKKSILLAAGAKTQIQADRLIELMQQQPEKFSVTPEQKISIRGDFDSLKSVYSGLRQSIQSFASI